MMLEALYYDVQVKGEIITSVQATIENAIMKAKLDMVLGAKDNIILDHPAVATSMPVMDVVKV